MLQFSDEKKYNSEKVYLAPVKRRRVEALASPVEDDDGNESEDENRNWVSESESESDAAEREREIGTLGQPLYIKGGKFGGGREEKRWR